MKTKYMMTSLLIISALYVNEALAFESCSGGDVSSNPCFNTIIKNNTNDTFQPYVTLNTSGSGTTKYLPEIHPNGSFSYSSQSNTGQTIQIIRLTKNKLPISTPDSYEISLNITCDSTDGDWCRHDPALLSQSTKTTPTTFTVTPTVKNMTVYYTITDNK